MSTPARRSGPRNDVDVPTLLVDTAERLFGRFGTDGVSLRSISREVGVAPAALGHHFSSKRALVQAVLQRRSRALATRTFENLDRLRSADTEVTPRQVVDAILMPFVELLAADPERGLSWMKLFARLALDEDPIWVAELGEAPSLAEIFVEVAARALPNLSDREVQRRTGIAMYSMLTALASADLVGYGCPLGPQGLEPDFVNQLALFTSAGMVGGTR